MALTLELFTDAQKVRQWKAFLNRAGLTVEVELAEVATFIAGFVMPLIETTRVGGIIPGVGLQAALGWKPKITSSIN